MGAPSARATKRVRPKIPAATFRPGISKLYEEREHPEDNPEAALDRWSKVGGGAETTFKPHIGEVYRELEESGALRVDSIESRVRWEQIEGKDAQNAGDKGGDSGGSVISSVVSAVKAWANKKT
ncbi:MAG: hypothetical protein AAF460_06830 [Pseudomonadota bacterium]